MPRSKKQKTNHHSNNQPYSTRNHYQAANDKMAGLSHEEIWDDSALLRSWDDAVKEYEFYHSIHARGEDVDEVLRQAELAEQEKLRPQQTQHQNTSTKSAIVTNDLDPTAPNDQPDDRNTSSDEEGEIDEDEDEDEYGGTPIQQSSSLHPQPAQIHPSASLSGPNTTTTIGPNGILATDPSSGTANTTGANMNVNTNQDQTLENLKMAYYWAGYYSGLYDGQRQSQGQGQA